MHINRTNYKYTLIIDSLPYRNTISLVLFSNNVRNKYLPSNVPTNGAVWGTQESTCGIRSWVIPCQIIQAVKPRCQGFASRLHHRKVLMK